jgi:anti-anti-sigma factor
VKLSVTRLDDTDVVKVSGEIDITTIAEVEEFFTALDAPVLVIDLTEVTFMDTSAIQFLLHSSTRADGGPREVSLVVTPQSSVHVLLKLTGLTDQLTIVDSAGDVAVPSDEHR